jgi:hypothetical protein
MARTKINQRSANRGTVPMGATGGRTPPSKLTVALFGTSIIAAVWAAAMMTSFGRVAYVYFFAYSEFYMGVLSLVSLSITIMLGLVATDRLVLSIRQRVLLQSAHRTFGIIAVAALAMHLWTKLMETHIGVIDIFIPFLRSSNTLYVGLGTISGWIMVITMWTGIVRAKFIGRGKPWMWRSIHATSYLMWPIALVHGLSAGRPAAVWVIVSYVVCILGVLLGLAVRISVSLNRKKDFASQAGTGGPGSIKPVGQLVPTSSPVLKKRPSRRAETVPAGARVSADRGGAPVAVLEAFTPAAGVRTADAPVSPAVAAPMAGPPPISVPPYDEDQPRRGDRSRRGADEEYTSPRARRAAEDQYAAPRGRGYADEDDMPAPRRSRADRTERYEPAERLDEDTRPFSPRAIESGRRRFEDDDAPRSRRRAEDDRAYETQRYEPEPRPRGRRYADEEEAPAPRRARAEIEAPRGRRYADDDEPAPRGRRYATDDEPAPRPRRAADDDPRGRRYAQDDRYDDAAPRRGSRYADDAPARASRYAEPEPAPRRRGGGNAGRADSGRHSRSEFVDLSAPPADPNYLEPDDTPTLVDMAARRARRASQQEAPLGASRGARRGRGRGNDDAADDHLYWRQLRGEAQ